MTVIEWISFAIAWVCIGANAVMVVRNAKAKQALDAAIIELETQTARLKVMHTPTRSDVEALALTIYNAWQQWPSQTPGVTWAERAAKAALEGVNDRPIH